VTPPLDPFIVRAARACKRGPRHVWRRAMDVAGRRAIRPWTRLYPSLLTDRALLRAARAADVNELWDSLSRQAFFVRPADRERTAAAFVSAYPDARDGIIASADAAARHEFDLLGSGPVPLGDSLPWHTDFKTNREWPLEYSADIQYNELERPSDVKVPWELSRCQHFTRLGQAYWLTGDDRYAREFVAETSDWIARNPYGYGVNWACAMDIALRAVSWIWGFYYMADAPACRDEGFRAAFLRSLFMHGEFIATHLERADVNGNHYLCDGVGLVFVGGFFRRARRAQRWLDAGREIVTQEVFTQTTADGVDFEQSTAYHRLVLEAFFTSFALLKRHGEIVPDACWTRLEKMCEFVQAYTKPDGSTPLIGDADDGRVQMLGLQAVNDHRYLLSSAALLFNRGDFMVSASRCWEETFWMLGADAPARFATLPADPSPLLSAAFPDGGVYVLRGSGTHVVVDCAEVGMHGRGGHGHNDILSFELFMNGCNLVTDCGAYLYTASREWRNRFRSTAFHNGVQVDDEEVNRFIGPDALWQLQYDAVPAGATLTRDERTDSFSGSHRGYERLQAPVSHTRQFVVDKKMPCVVVRDRLDGSSRHMLTWRFHLDSRVSAELHGREVRLSSGPHEVWLRSDLPPAFGVALEDGWVSPRYGVKVPATVVVWKGVATLPIATSHSFSLLRTA
jgi:hypothetical protein